MSTAKPLGYMHAADIGALQKGGGAQIVVLTSRDCYTAPVYDQAALDAAVAAERERCAKLCEGLPEYGNAFARLIRQKSSEAGRLAYCTYAGEQP